jgi:N-acetylglucosaminyl-diphospho-decaprenol L-rhamnosyltransferase
VICISVVSHGQVGIAAQLLRSLALVAPGLVRQLIYTRNIPEAELPPVELDGVEVVVIENPHPRGFGENHNAAFARCSQTFFCVVNPDILLQSDPFGPLLRCLEDPELGLVAPVVTTPSLTVENTARALYTPVELIRQKLSPHNRAAEADWLAGMFLMFRSDAYREIGGFDEGYFLYIEDVDICTRLRLAGWRLAQCQRCSVIHDARKQSHRSLKYTSWHIAGMLRYWSTPSFWRYRALLRRRRKGGNDTASAVAGADLPRQDGEQPRAR